MITEQLTRQGDFLYLSRTTPDVFSNPVSFSLDNGTRVNIQAAGIISFTPEHVGEKDIVLSSGIHGNETAPIEICDDLVKSILKGQVNLAHRVLFLFGNLPAMDLAERFVTENMNRLFSGAHSQGKGLVNPERLRAKQLEEAVEQFFTQRQAKRFHYDLHTAIRASKNDKFAVYPFLHGGRHCTKQLAFLLACGVNTVLLSEAPTTTFSYFSSSRFNAHAFTVELGKVQPFGQNDMSKFTQVRDTLTRLLTSKHLSLPSFEPTKMLIYRVNQVINKEQEDFLLHFADDTPNFTDYTKGEVLATESGAQYVTQYDGEAIVFPNANVEIGQRALLTVVPTTIAQG